MKPILEIEDLSKKYRINSNIQPYLSLRENLFSFLQPKKKFEDFWALQNVSFKVMPGDTLGIIGKNGAGKSTLLKILSKITPPTSGNITCRGRIASLLEVGTGFHSELSGRENVYMNGSILGMRRSEIKQNFDAIVDFAGVEQFIDTPLKHYSSGMQLRLAFAVAAFLQNEIVIIDEVLSVGDVEFQKKCLGKMNDISKSGRTVLFVSHNLTQLKNLCQRSVLLENGKLVFDGTTSEAIARYQHKQIPGKIQLDFAVRKGPTQSLFKFTGLKIENEQALFEKQTVQFTFEFTCEQKINNLIIGLLISDVEGNKILELRSNQQENTLSPSEKGTFEAELICTPYLRSGVYSISIGARSKEGLLEYLPDVYTIEIKPENTNNFADDLSGYFAIPSRWQLK